MPPPLTARLRSLFRDDAPSDPAARLRDEAVVWIAAVRVDGQPHLVPTWFTWDGQAFWFFGKAHSVKVRALRDEPRCMVATGEPDADFDVQLVEGRAELVDEAPDVVRAAHARKYARALRRAGIGWQDYWATYRQAVRIEPARFLPWHGRGQRWQPQPLRTPVPTGWVAAVVR